MFTKRTSLQAPSLIFILFALDTWVFIFLNCSMTRPLLKISSLCDQVLKALLSPYPLSLHWELNFSFTSPYSYFSWPCKKGSGPEMNQKSGWLHGLDATFMSRVGWSMFKGSCLISILCKRETKHYKLEQKGHLERLWQARLWLRSNNCVKNLPNTENCVDIQVYD